METEIKDNTERRHLESVREPVIFPHIPLTDGRPASAGQVAEIIWFLSSGLATHLSGAEVFIDGAESLLKG